MSEADAGSTRVVELWSRAFTGTTWFGLVLGAHPSSFSLGNPQRAWERFVEHGPATCRVHYGTCPFWGQLADLGPAQDEFLSAIRTVSGATTLVLYRPSGAPWRNQLDDGAFGELVRVEIIRDVRARMASWKRRNPSETVATALAGPMRSIEPRADTVALRHERLAVDGDHVVTEASRLTGLALDESALTYWRHGPHPAHGNGITNATCRWFDQRSQESGADQLGSLYLEYLDRLDSGRGYGFIDDRWTTELNRYERWLIDERHGAQQEALGYERDQFPAAEVETFRRLGGS